MVLKWWGGLTSKLDGYPITSDPHLWWQACPWRKSLSRKIALTRIKFYGRKRHCGIFCGGMVGESRHHLFAVWSEMGIVSQRRKERKGHIQLQGPVQGTAPASGNPRKLQVKAFQTAFGQMQGCADFMRLWRNFMPRKFSTWTGFTQQVEPQSYYGA